jgi:hypothetical protein
MLVISLVLALAVFLAVPAVAGLVDQVAEAYKQNLGGILALVVLGLFVYDIMLVTGKGLRDGTMRRIHQEGFYGRQVPPKSDGADQTAKRVAGHGSFFGSLIMAMNGGLWLIWATIAHGRARRQLMEAAAA